MGALLTHEADEFADLDLRTYIGPYLGRQFYESDLLSLQGEFGLVYAKERFRLTEDNEYPGATWALYLSSDYFGGDSSAYIEHDGLLDLTETNDLILNTLIGISFPVVGGFEAAVEIEFEYDGGAVEDVNETDESYNVRLGYTW